MELWKDIEEYKELYQISNFGRVKSLKRIVNGRWGKTKISEKTLNIYPNKDNYLCVNFGLKQRTKSYRINRLVAQAFIPNPDNLPIVLHLDNNPLNNNVTNLKWGTQQDNVNQCIANNRFAKGEKSGKAKLTEDQVIMIRDIISNKKDTKLGLSKKLGISRTTIQAIMKRKTWKHI